MLSTSRQPSRKTQTDHADFKSPDINAPHFHQNKHREIFLERREDLGKLNFSSGLSVLDNGLPEAPATSRPSSSTVTSRSPPALSESLPANLDFCREEHRLLSLQNWPSKGFMDVDLTAKSGFYYYGDRDAVRCHFCKLELSRWEEGDCADTDHSRWAPCCPLLLKKNTGNIPISSSDVCGIYDSNAPKHPAFMTEPARLESFRNWPARMKQTPEALADAGFYYAGTQDQTVCYQCGGGLKDWEDEDDPWEQHALWFTRCPYLVMVKGKNYIDSVLRAEKTPTQEKISAPAPTIPEPAPESNRLSNDKECKICLVNERNICFIPCGHVVACPKCAMSLMACPICRSEFTSTVKVYYP